MADDVTYPIPDGTIQACDLVAGVYYPRAKVVWGPDNTVNDTDIASGKPMPVQLRGSDGTDRSNLLPVSDGGGSLTVDGTVAATYATTGSGNATGALRVELANNGTGVLATVGAVTTVTTVTTVSTVTAVTTLTGGGVAHDGADSGNPVKVGGRAVNAEIAAVSNNDRTDFLTDLVGKQIVLPYANPENFVSGVISSAMTGTTSTLLVAAPASGLRNYITQITVSCGHATQGTDILIQDGNGGTTLYVIPAAAVFGGACVTFPTPLRQTSTATALYCANVTTGSSTKVSASGYKGA